MCSPLRVYEDILAPRKAETSNFLWISRTLRPKIAYSQTGAATPQRHKDAVLGSPKIQELLQQLSREKDVSLQVLEEQVSQILDEIGYNKKLHVIRWMALILVKICSRVSSGIYVNRSGLTQLRASMGNCPVVFVPSHRSYADFILMSLLCFSEDIAIPAIAAGMDFHGMKGMGSALRDTGAFFMRRSYNDDSLYWTTFKQYVLQITAGGQLPLEFFIEGTRSRTNKSLTPKYGLILMILKALFFAQVPDILFVPINISYDRIMEETLFAFELLGIPKPKESTSGFFKSLSIIKENYGSIYFHFAQPLSAKEFFGPLLDRSVHGLQPLHQQEVTDAEKRLIPLLAQEIVHVQQKHCVLTVFNLLALVLNNNLMQKRPTRLGDVAGDVLGVRGLVERFGGFVASESVEGDVLEALEVHRSIVRLEAGVVEVVSDRILLDKVDPGRLRGHELAGATISFAVPFIMLQIYVNPVLHYFVDGALLVAVLRRFPEGLAADALFQQFHFLRTLLCNEFVRCDSRAEEELEAAVENCVETGVIEKSNGCFKMGDDKLGELFYNFVQCFIYAYCVVCSFLVQCELQSVEENVVLSKVQAAIETAINTNAVFIHPYSLSLDTIINCLNSLTSQRVLLKSRRGNKIWYEINKSKIYKIQNELEQYIPNTLRAPQQVASNHQMKTKL